MRSGSLGNVFNGSPLVVSEDGAQGWPVRVSLSAKCKLGQRLYTNLPDTHGNLSGTPM